MFSNQRPRQCAALEQRAMMLRSNKQKSAKSSRPEIVRVYLLCDQYRKSARRISAAVCKADVDHDAAGDR
jgi:hypothetical protein